MSCQDVYWVDTHAYSHSGSVTQLVRQVRVVGHAYEREREREREGERERKRETSS